MFQKTGRRLMLSHLQEGFKQEGRKLSAHQYLSSRASYGLNPDEAQSWEKLAWIQQGQIIVDKPDFLLAQSNLLGVHGTSGGHCLAAFQVFLCCSHSLFLKKPMCYYPYKGSGSLADGQHPEQGGKCSFSSRLLVTSGVPRD